MAVWQPKRLTPAQLEERRCEAVRLLRTRRFSEARIARDLGVSRPSVSRWKALLEAGGAGALKRRPHPGRRSKLSDAEWRRLLGILTKGAIAAGFPTERWTLSRVAAVIFREFGVRYHPRSLGSALSARGFSPQQPIPRAKEREDALVEAWLKRDWPRIKRGLEEMAVPLPFWMKRVTRFGPA